MAEFEKIDEFTVHIIYYCGNKSATLATVVPCSNIEKRKEEGRGEKEEKGENGKKRRKEKEDIAAKLQDRKEKVRRKIA